MKPLPIVANGDSLDWKNISADEIVTRVMTKVGNGSIIQFHTGTEHTADALPEILSLLSGQGYSFVSVGELIYYDNFTIDHNGTQKKTKQSEILTDS